MHGLGGDVDHVRLRIAQPNQQKQQPLLVEGGADKVSKLPLIQRHRRDDDRRVAPVVARGECAPNLCKAWLERLEGGKLLLERQVAGKRRLREACVSGRSSVPGQQSAHYATRTSVRLRSSEVPHVGLSCGVE